MQVFEPSKVKVKLRLPTVVALRNCLLSLRIEIEMFKALFSSYQWDLMIKILKGFKTGCCVGVSIKTV